jgi:hypothetical protein
MGKNLGYNEIMTEDRRAGLMTAAAVLALFAAMWEAMLGFVLAVFVLVGAGVVSNSKCKNKRDKILRYAVLGLVVAILDAAAIYDIKAGGVNNGWLGITVLVLSVVVVGAGVWGERRRSYSGHK